MHLKRDFSRLQLLHLPSPFQQLHFTSCYLRLSSTGERALWCKVTFFFLCVYTFFFFSPPCPISHAFDSLRRSYLHLWLCVLVHFDGRIIGAGLLSCACAHTYSNASGQSLCSLLPVGPWGLLSPPFLMCMYVCIPWFSVCLCTWFRV